MLLKWQFVASDIADKYFYFLYIHILYIPKYFVFKCLWRTFIYLEQGDSSSTASLYSEFLFCSVIVFIVFWVLKYIHTYIHAHKHIHTYAHTYIYTYKHTYIRTNVHSMYQLVCHKDKRRRKKQSRIYICTNLQCTILQILYKISMRNHINTQKINLQSKRSLYVAIIFINSINHLAPEF